MRVLSGDTLRVLYEVEPCLPSEASETMAVFCEPAVSNSGNSQITPFLVLNPPLPSSITASRQGGACKQLAWSPDGALLAVRRVGGRTTFVIDAAQRKVTRCIVTASAVTDLSWSAGAPASHQSASMHSHYAPLLAITQRQSCGGVALFPPGHVAFRLPTPLSAVSAVRWSPPLDGARFHALCALDANARAACLVQIAAKSKSKSSTQSTSRKSKLKKPSRMRK